MSRNRLYGKNLIITAAALAEANTNVLAIARERLSRTLTEQMKLLRVLGIDIDIDSIDFTESENTGDPLAGMILGYKLRGRQRRNWLQRILWAVRL